MLFYKMSKFIALLVVLALFQDLALAIKKSYVVYLGGHSHGLDVTSADINQVTTSHIQLLASFLGSEEKANDAIFYSYKRHINGFAAVLEDHEATEIAKHPDVISVFPNQRKKLHTTHSWDFLLLERRNRGNGSIHSTKAWKRARFGENVIIANLDTGVWPESKSFSDEGYGPIPSKWKGKCQVDKHTHHFCNRKLIGARYFHKGYAAFYRKPLNSSFHTPRDPVGHGTHTLSTAAGNMVPGANVFGLANGTAKGGSPRARAAAYKVCWGESDCFDADILKAFDVAIHDGVDVLSVSLGGGAQQYSEDSIAIGSFHAVKHGIPVVASAGNSGPLPGTVSNVAPWIITVAASTIDRQIQANVRLKNGSFFMGSSLSKPLPSAGYYPLVNGGDARSAGASEYNATLCNEGTLDHEKVKGKIVVCLRGDSPRVEKGMVARRAGAAGMILINGDVDGADIVADPHVLPATHISYTDGLILLNYINSTKNPEGLITTPEAVLNIKPAPRMAAFSSRGPNTITTGILKPDITAPGVGIIAAYTEGVSASGLALDKRTTPFNTLSGTSMSCPHISGVVGLLKNLHPDWSPAAIKSAIMTTARVKDNTGNPLRDYNNLKSNSFAYGSGHIRPKNAMHPGLVYDLSVSDYLDFLCGIGYNESTIRLFSGSHLHHCPGKKYNIMDFNYPSISVIYFNETVKITRKVKNVGPPATYASRIRHPLGYTVTVAPDFLIFTETGQEQRFELTITARKSTSENDFKYRFGGIVWSDGRHFVRSPITVVNAAAESLVRS